MEALMHTIFVVAVGSAVFWVLKAAIAVVRSTLKGGAVWK